MPSRRRRRAGKRQKGRKQAQKRKRPMDFDDTMIISPYNDSLHIQHPIDCEPAIKKMFLWCYNQLPSVKQPFHLVYHILFPTRHLVGEIKDVREQLSVVKVELNNLQQKFNEFEIKLKDGSPYIIGCNKMSNSLSFSTSCPIPPPPPPPPPPPLPSLVTRSSTRKAADTKTSACNVMLQDILKVKLKKSESNADQSDENHKKKTESIPRITLSDLKSVKLKSTSRTEPGRERENETPPSPKSSVLRKDSKPRITLSDLNSVKLKSTSQTEPGTEEENKTPKSVVLRKTLRQTKIKRSPGGTPLTKRDCSQSTATGPTADITRALRRKFRSIRTSPLLEIGNTSSPM